MTKMQKFLSRWKRIDWSVIPVTHPSFAFLPLFVFLTWFLQDQVVSEATWEWTLFSLHLNAVMGVGGGLYIAKKTRNAAHAFVASIPAMALAGDWVIVASFGDFYLDKGISPYAWSAGQRLISWFFPSEWAYQAYPWRELGPLFDFHMVGFPITLTMIAIVFFVGVSAFAAMDEWNRTRFEVIES